jgi:hypothetical protein
MVRDSEPGEQLLFTDWDLAASSDMQALAYVFDKCAASHVGSELHQYRRRGGRR